MTKPRQKSTSRKFTPILKELKVPIWPIDNFTEYHWNMQFFHYSF